MRKKIHMCQSVVGPLKNWSKREWKSATSYMTKDDGSRYTPDELKAEFLRLYGEGIHVIPLGDCDNFDDKTGCRGHDIPDPIPAT